MAEESEEACLVNPKLPLSCGQMVYTDGISTAPSVVAASGAAATGGGPQTFQQSTQSRASTVTATGIATNVGIGGSTGLSTTNPYDINDDIILSQFHADAIKQAGCGKFQFIATLIVGICLSGHVIQVYSIFYIIPSVEVEYCILDEEKNWVSNITLLGIGCGSLLFSALASKNGRKKMLMSCLAISSVFSGECIITVTADTRGVSRKLCTIYHSINSHST